MKIAVHGDYDRKWMSDDYFDLIVWYTPADTVHGFKLCYGKPQWGRALTWLSDRGFSHMAIDDGEGQAESNQAPILVPDGFFPAEEVVREFRRRSAGLPADLRELVRARISEFTARRS